MHVNFYYWRIIFYFKFQLAYRYVKLYIKDLKRRVKSILQISENSSTNKSNTTTTIGKNSINRNHSTPIITIQKENEEEKQVQQAMVKSSDIIENALNKYLQVVTTARTFDLNKIVEVSLVFQKL